jgi:hypothetical protein
LIYSALPVAVFPIVLVELLQAKILSFSIVHTIAILQNWTAVLEEEQNCAAVLTAHPDLQNGGG